MAERQSPVFAFHADADLFREALNFTAARTGFVPRLIEKDYFCTLLLAHLAVAEPRRSDINPCSETQTRPSRSRSASASRSCFRPLDSRRGRSCSIPSAVIRSSHR